MIVQQRGKALGTDISWSVVVDGQQQAEHVFLLIRNFIDEFERRFSRFLPDSEVSNINAHAGELIACSEEFRELVRVAVDMQSYTEGLCSTLLLGEIQRAGYLGSWPQPDTLGQVPDLRDRHARLDDTITLKGDCITIPKNTALDFGGIGKGFALDKVADIIEMQGIYNYWVSLGGDIIARGVDDDGKSWQILLEAIGTGVMTVESGRKRTAVATSTILKRRGEGWHHIIDPRTGKPAKTTLVSASVVAETGVLADVIAKSLLIEGNHAKDFWKKHRQTRAYVMSDDGVTQEFA